MNIQLSTLFGRDQNNAIKPGVLSLKRMTTTHFDTGQYRIEIERNNREKPLLSLSQYLLVIQLI